MKEQSKSPFTGAGTPPKFPTGRGTSNRDWWPNSLNLKVLSQHSSKVNPMGKKFNYSKIPMGKPNILMASRLLKSKGVYEFINAVKIIKKQKLNARFVLVGDLDEENPSGIKLNIIKSWINDNLVEYWGHKKNMTKILNLASIIVLPSYREGFPKVLMEAAACGRPSIATMFQDVKMQWLTIIQVF